MLKLQWQVDDEVYEYRLLPDNPILMGRHSECDIALYDERISRQHASIYTRDGVTYLHNLSESSPVVFTVPDSNRIMQRDEIVELAAGQVFELGVFEFKVLIYDPATETIRQVICPNCNNTVEDSTGECPSCGVSLAYARLV